MSKLEYSCCGSVAFCQFLFGFFIQDSFLLSGGNDYSLFLWNLGSDVEGQHIAHDAKINAIEGKDLGRIFVADFSPVVRVFDLSVR
ncbi:hypothetical protein FGIG_06191 [Fasciola gigantica]|uniref:Uncharacterized protein n=1 Tax=Fasciola gigantica TaxID=46835 RepID=A0A504Z3Y3_FASGI|nr:hypothetical protein FGIG_06191 [Fasciola gigantica]